MKRNLLVQPLARRQVLGPGRDRRFQLDQFVAPVHGLPMVFFDDGKPEGDVLFFTHGLAANVTHWLHVAPAFASRYRVIGVDLPGCGETPALAGGYSIDAFAAQVIGLLDVLGIGRATFVGHSLGGMVTMELHSRAPERVKGMLLISSAGLVPVHPLARLVGRLTLREDLLQLILPHVWQGILRQVFARDNEYTRSFKRSVAATYDPDQDVASLAAVMSGLKEDFLCRDYATSLDDLKVPLHLMWGKKDRLTPVASLPHLAERSAHIHIELVADCGHMPNIETPSLVIAALERLIHATEPPRE